MRQPHGAEDDSCTSPPRSVSIWKNSPPSPERLGESGERISLGRGLFYFRVLASICSRSFMSLFVLRM